LGTPDKVETFKEYAELYNINPEHVLYGRWYSWFSRDEINRSSNVSKGF
jgi:hypothetical protein